MPNFIEVNYEQTGQSKSTNHFGMREIQEKDYEVEKIVHNQIVVGK